MNWKLIEDKSWCSLEQLFEWVREMNTVQQDIRYHAEGSVAEHTRMVLVSIRSRACLFPFFSFLPLCLHYNLNPLCVQY